MVSECIILWKNTQNGLVGAVSDERRVDYGPAIFASESEAEAFARSSNLLQAFPYQIVPLEF